MIQHWLVNKKVHWYTLEQSNTKRINWSRCQHGGLVCDVDSTGTIAAVQKQSGQVVLVEVCELTKRKGTVNKQ